MGKVEGDIAYVSFMPGRGDGYLVLTLARPDGEDRVTIFANEPGSKLTWAGALVDFPTLLGKLATNRARAEAVPRPDRYGACLEATFVPYE